MAKRFTDSDKWNKKWFRKLSPAYKCFWVYVCDSCNIAGIWDVDFELAEIFIGESIDQSDVRQVFEKQYQELSGGTKWFIKDFIGFQYGELKDTNNFHRSIIAMLKSSGVSEPLVCPSISTIEPETCPDVIQSAESIIANPRRLSEHQQFVESFGALYTSLSGQPFKADKKHFVMVANLIKKYGVKAVEEKAKILAVYCQRGEVWFTKNGVADFTIEKLSGQWNSIIPQVRKSDREVKDEKLVEGLIKERERDGLLVR